MPTVIETAAYTPQYPGTIIYHPDHALFQKPFKSLRKRMSLSETLTFILENTVNVVKKKKAAITEILTSIPRYLP